MVTTASAGAKSELCRQRCGASAVLDYRSPSCWAELRALPPFDAVVVTTSARDAWRCEPLVAARGGLCTIVGPETAPPPSPRRTSSH